MAMSFNSEINDFKKHKLNEKLITETISSSELTIQLNVKYLSSCEIIINMRITYSIKFMHSIRDRNIHHFFHTKNIRLCDVFHSLHHVSYMEENLMFP